MMNWRLKLRGRIRHTITVLPWQYSVFLINASDIQRPVLSKHKTWQYEYYDRRLHSETPNRRAQRHSVSGFHVVNRGANRQAKPLNFMSSKNALRITWLLPGLVFQIFFILRSAYTGSGFYFTLFDDAMISMTYGRTLAERVYKTNAIFTENLKH